MPHSAPWTLRLQAFYVQQVTYLFYLLDHYLSSPRPPKPTLKTSIRSSHQIGAGRAGNIELLFYYPNGTKSLHKDSPTLPLVINIHGGGWTFGTASMDARWAARVNAAGAVMVSIGYRLGPSNPFPLPLDDCEDAARWVLNRAAEYRIDPDRVVVSGFSAGGNMSFATAARLRNCSNGSPPGLRGVLAFYPLVDHFHTTEEKVSQMDDPSAPIASTPKSWQKLFKSSYLPDRATDRTQPLLSPALATDDWLVENLPDRIGLWTCEYDYLLKEGEQFRERLAGLGKITNGRMMEGVRHAWDRVPTFSKGNPLMDRMYTEAIDALDDMVGLDMARCTR